VTPTPHINGLQVFGILLGLGVAVVLFGALGLLLTKSPTFGLRIPGLSRILVSCMHCCVVVVVVVIIVCSVAWLLLLVAVVVILLFVIGCGFVVVCCCCCLLVVVCCCCDFMPHITYHSLASSPGEGPCG